MKKADLSKLGDYDLFFGVIDIEAVGMFRFTIPFTSFRRFYMFNGVTTIEHRGNSALSLGGGVNTDAFLFTNYIAEVEGGDDAFGLPTDLSGGGVMMFRFKAFN